MDSSHFRLSDNLLILFLFCFSFFSRYGQCFYSVHFVSLTEHIASSQLLFLLLWTLFLSCRSCFFYCGHCFCLDTPVSSSMGIVSVLPLFFPSYRENRFCPSPVSPAMDILLLFFHTPNIILSYYYCLVFLQMRTFLPASHVYTTVVLFCPVSLISYGADHFCSTSLPLLSLHVYVSFRLVCSHMGSVSGLLPLFLPRWT
jgi:hypothetical protein